MHTADEAAQDGRPGLDGKRRGRALVGAVMLLIGVGYTVHASTLPMGTMAQPGAAVFPLIVGVGCIAISLLTVAEALLSTKVAGPIEAPAPGRGPIALGMAGAIAGYLVLLPMLGQYVAASLFCAATVGLLGTRPWWRAGAYGVVMALLISYVFIELLGVRLPAGLLGR